MSQHNSLTKFRGKEDAGPKMITSWLLFRNKSWEFDFLMESDSLFRYYTIGAMIIIAVIGSIQFTVFDE